MGFGNFNDQTNIWIIIIIIILLFACCSTGNGSRNKMHSAFW